MTRLKYESPKFEFQEIQLVERVAKRCWGYDYAFVDDDLNPATPPVEYYFVESGGCEGNAENKVQKRLEELLNQFPSLVGHVGVNDVLTNIQTASPYITPPGGVS